MATVTRTYLVDDLDGSEDEVETVRFSVDKTDYEIDLTPENATRLREKLERFIAAASPQKPAKASKPAPARRSKSKAAPAPSNRDQTQAIREWAKQNSYEVSPRGRISKVVKDAFEAAH